MYAIRSYYVVDTFFDNSARSFDSVFRFFEAETCQGANNFNYVDLLVACIFQDNVEFSFFFFLKALYFLKLG